MNDTPRVFWHVLVNGQAICQAAETTAIDRYATYAHPPVRPLPCQHTNLIELTNIIRPYRIGLDGLTFVIVPGMCPHQGD